jgi:hypothetical protein
MEENRTQSGQIVDIKWSQWRDRIRIGITNSLTTIWHSETRRMSGISSIIFLCCIS